MDINKEIQKMIDAKMSDDEIVSRVINYEGIEKASALAKDLMSDVMDKLEDYINKNEIPIMDESMTNNMSHYNACSGFRKEVINQLSELLKFIGR